MKSISFHLCCSHEVPMHRLGVNLLATTHNITHLPFGTAILNGNFRLDVVFIALDVDEGGLLRRVGSTEGMGGE